MTTWTDLKDIVHPMLTYIGPHVCLRQEVALKLLRLFDAFFQDVEAMQKSVGDAQQASGSTEQSA
jgi:hypothetical protein